MRVAVVICALVAATGASWAGDPSVGPAPATNPPPPPQAALPFSWTGTYLRGSGDLGLGLNAAGTKALAPQTSSLTGSSIGTINGSMGEGAFGANWQNGDAVFGFQGDMQWNNERAAPITSCDLGCSLNERVRMPWMATMRARAGTAFDRVYLYGTGGFATKGTAENPNGGGFGNTPSFNDFTARSIDWTVGGGLEMAIDRDLSAKIEYLYMPSSAPGGAAGPLFEGPAEATKSNVVRGGIDYRLSIGQ